MSFLQKLFGKRKEPVQIEEDMLLEANVCPNCWGKQEYEGQYFEYEKDQTKSNINRDKAHRKAFVQQFIETHVSGIRLKTEGEFLHCPTCKGKYKHVSSKTN